LREYRVPLETETGRGEHPEFTSCQHVFLARLKPRLRSINTRELRRGKLSRSIVGVY
jgi:hypothetical protein